MTVTARPPAPPDQRAIRRSRYPEPPAVQHSASGPGLEHSALVQNRRTPALLVGAVVGAVAVAFATVLVGGLFGAGSAPAHESVAQVRALPSPTGLFVDPEAPAALQAQEWQRQGRTEDARRMGVLAAQPVPLWATEPTGRVAAQVGSYAVRARAVGQRPLVVAYHVPNRDCSSYSGGGAEDAGDYHTWIRELAGALGGPATVVVEPDAVPHEVQGCSGQAKARHQLLTDAVEVLKAAGATVFLDAGNPGFVRNVGDLTAALEHSGVREADGFSLNVANFYPTTDDVAYGRKISDALGGAHFVVDTSRNGNGRYPGDRVDGGPSWCNPPGRAIGQAPTTSTGLDRVDAFLWIKRPGESDGSCRPGDPAAGQWMPEYALALVPPS